MATNWEEIRRNARATAYDAPPEWPHNVKQISMGGISLLGIDDQNQLYWDGKPVEIKRRLKLSWLQFFAAAIVGLATVVGGIGTGLSEGFDFGCKMHWWTQGCPSNGTGDHVIRVFRNTPAWRALIQVKSESRTWG